MNPFKLKRTYQSIALNALKNKNIKTFIYWSQKSRAVELPPVNPFSIDLYDEGKKKFDNRDKTEFDYEKYI